MLFPFFSRLFPTPSPPQSPQFSSEPKRDASVIAAEATDELQSKKQRQEEAHGDDDVVVNAAASSRSPALAAELTAAAEDASAPLRASLFGTEAEREAAESFRSAKPFPHIVIRDLIVDSERKGGEGEEGEGGEGSKAAAADGNPTSSSPSFSSLPLPSSLLRAVREEILEHVSATYKETDLFRVFQTGDLANIDGLPQEERETKLPALCALRSALSSEKFVSLVEKITGCGSLAPGRVDLSCNVYAPRGHLLTHDDVIGSRRVSFIVYLNGPDDPWCPETDGGALELYPLVSSSSSFSKGSNEGDTAGLPPPSVAPSALLPPFWNSMAMFVVTPGVSYHSVQEVTSREGKARMSISGWYHAPQAPKGVDSEASLAQLRLGKGQDAVRDHAAFVDVIGEEEKEEKENEDAEARALRLASVAPTEGDLEHLSRFVSAAYLRPQAWAAVRRKFEEDGNVQLHGFLRPELARALAVATKKADDDDGLGRANEKNSSPSSSSAPRPPPSDYLVGAKRGWTAVGPPHKQRYLRFEGEAASEQALREVAASSTSTSASASASAEANDKNNNPGPLLAALRRDLFSTLPFFRLLKQLTTITQLGSSGEVRRFRPGLDYSVAHYGVPTADPRLDAVLCFVDDGSLKQEEANGDGKGKRKQNNNDDDESEWAAGEVGGFEAYVLGDDDDEDAGAVEAGEGGGAKKGDQKKDAAVYKKGDGAGDGDDTGVLNVPAAANCLFLLLRDEGLMRFVKYVSAAAPGSRWDLAMEFKPQDDDDEDEDDEEKKEEK